jgi:hypothetical protein
MGVMGDDLSGGEQTSGQPAPNGVPPTHRRMLARRGCCALLAVWGVGVVAAAYEGWTGWDAVTDSHHVESVSAIAAGIVLVVAVVGWILAVRGIPPGVFAATLVAGSLALGFASLSLDGSMADPCSCAVNFNEYPTTCPDHDDWQGPLRTVHLTCHQLDAVLDRARAYDHAHHKRYDEDGLTGTGWKVDTRLVCCGYYLIASRRGTNAEFVVPEFV